MHDGAPPRFALSVHVCLDQKLHFPVGLSKEGGVLGKTLHNGTIGGPDSERYHQRPTRLPAEGCGCLPRSFEEAGECRRRCLH